MNIETFRVWASTVFCHGKQKADMAEHPKVSSHVGLLVNEPPGSTWLLFV